jgi:hypothetical protein
MRLPGCLHCAQTRCARSNPEFFYRIDRGFSQSRIIGQAKIIV